MATHTHIHTHTHTHTRFVRQGCFLEELVFRIWAKVEEHTSLEERAQIILTPITMSMDSVIGFLRGCRR